MDMNSSSNSRTNNDINNNNNNNNNNRILNEYDIFTNIARSKLNQEYGAGKRGIANSLLSQQAKDQLIENMRLDYIIPLRNSEKCPFWLSFSPDGVYLALATNDSVEIFDSNSGELLYSLSNHTQVVSIVIWFHTPHEYSERDLPEKYKNRNKNYSTSTHSYHTTIKSPYNSFVTCSLDNTINIYRNFTFITSLKDHKDWLKSLALTYDDQLLLSGCASSKICGWDMNDPKIIFQIPSAHPHTGTDLNTINTLKFPEYEKNIFISGSRYGSWRMWDIRQPLDRPIFHVQAHNKLNTLHFTKDARNILSSGRDGCLRLWDIRTVKSNEDYLTNLTSSQVTKKGVLKEYRGHKCSGYNIGCSFINNDRYIISGSEDNCVYIYNTETTKVVGKQLTHKYAVHLISPSPVKDDFRVATSSIDSCNIHVYSPQLADKEKDGEVTISSKFLGTNKPKEEDVSTKVCGRDYIQRVTMEKLMLLHGDQLFKFYHSQSSPASLDNPEMSEIFKLIKRDFNKVFKMVTFKLGRKLGLNPRTRILEILESSIDTNLFDDDDEEDEILNNNNNEDDEEISDDDIESLLSGLGGGLYEHFDESEEDDDDDDDDESSSTV